MNPSTKRSPRRVSPVRASLAALSAALLVLLIGGCTELPFRPPATPTTVPTATPPVTQKVRVAYLPISNLAALYVAKDLNYFADEHLDVELTIVRSASTAITSIAEGDVDITTSDSVSPFQAGDNGTAATILTGIEWNTHPSTSWGICVPENSPIKSAGDLAHKKLGMVALKNVNRVAIDRWLIQNGVDTSTITYVVVSAPNMPNAIEHGDVDAGMCDPSQAVDQLRRIVHYYSYLPPDILLAGMVTSTAWAKQHPQEVEEFIRAYMKGVAYANARPTETRRIVARYLKVTAPASVAAIRWDGLLNRPVTTSDISWLSEYLHSQGYTSKTINPDSLIWHGGN